MSLAPTLPPLPRSPEVPAGARLLDELDRFFQRFVAFPNQESRWAVVLWIGHAHCIAAFDSTPRLALLSPEKGSGKTRTLEIIGLFAPSPLHAVNISAAALYRVVLLKQPTLLLDEADTYLGPMVAKQHEDVRGLINAGHRRGAEVYRAEVAGKAVRVVTFPAFAAAALAGIGDLPDTILDRSIIIGMKRRAEHEVIEPFRERLVKAEADTLRGNLEDWALEVVDAMADAWPTLPDGITDRAADVWEPLCAVADAAGGEWVTRARTAAIVINQARQSRDPSLGVQLLVDCRHLFDQLDIDRLSTDALLEALVKLDESPWGDLRGKPIDQRGLARRLRKYDVRPAPHRFDGGTLRGYLREDFADAWSRYLPVTDVTQVTHSESERGADVTHGDLGF